MVSLSRDGYETYKHTNRGTLSKRTLTQQNERIFKALSYTSTCDDNDFYAKGRTNYYPLEMWKM